MLPRVAKPGIRLDRELGELIGSLAQKVQNCRQGQPVDQLDLYRKAVQEIVDTLRHVLHPDDVRALVVTESYVWLMGGNGTTQQQIGLEIDALYRRLALMSDEVLHEAQRWMWAGSAIVPDTSVFVEVLDEGRNVITGFDWRELAEMREHQPCSVVIPLAVLAELDHLRKTARPEDRRKRVRDRVNELSEVIQFDGLQVIGPDLRLGVLVPGLEHTPMPVTDAEIIDQALQLHSRLAHGSSTKLVTADLSQANQARTAQLDVVYRPPIDRR